MSYPSVVAFNTPVNGQSWASIMSLGAAHGAIIIGQIQKYVFHSSLSKQVMKTDSYFEWLSGTITKNYVSVLGDLLTHNVFDGVHVFWISADSNTVSNFVAELNGILRFYGDIDCKVISGPQFCWVPNTAGHVHTPYALPNNFVAEPVDETVTKPVVEISFARSFSKSESVIEIPFDSETKLYSERPIVAEIPFDSTTKLFSGRPTVTEPDTKPVAEPVVDETTDKPVVNRTKPAHWTTVVQKEKASGKPQRVVAPLERPTKDKSTTKQQKVAAPTTSKVAAPIERPVKESGKLDPKFKFVAFAVVTYGDDRLNLSKFEGYKLVEVDEYMHYNIEQLDEKNPIKQLLSDVFVRDNQNLFIAVIPVDQFESRNAENPMDRKLWATEFKSKISLIQEQFRKVYDVYVRTHLMTHEVAL